MFSLPRPPLRPAALAAAAAFVSLAAGGPPASAEGFRDALIGTVATAGTAHIQLRGTANQRLADTGGQAAFQGGSDAHRQLWGVELLDEGRFGPRFRFDNHSTGESLRGNPSGGWREGAAVTTEPWSGWNSQRWRAEWAGNGRFRFRPVGTSLRLRSTDRTGGPAVLSAGGTWEERDFKLQTYGNVDSPSIALIRDKEKGVTTLFAYVKHSPEAPGVEAEGRIYASTDGGETWKKRATMDPFYGVTLFVDDGKLNMIFGRGRKLILGQSDDSGADWTFSDIHTFEDEENGRPVKLQSGGGAPVLRSGGYLHYAFMDENAESTGYPQKFRLRVASCAEDEDMSEASNWTVTEPRAFPESPARGGLRGGWMEANLVEGPDGRVWAIARVDHVTEGNVAAAMKLAGNRRTLQFVNQNDPEPDKPGFFTAEWAGCAKFHIRWHAGTGRYWVLSNPWHGDPSENPNDPLLRNKLSLYSSADLRSWDFERHLLEDDLYTDPAQSAWLTGFQQPSFVFEGDTIHYLSRTAYGTLDNYHDANRITYHRTSVR